MQTVMVVSGASERFWNQTPFRSYLFNAFSLLLPSGEQFVIRAMEDAVTRLPEGAPLQEEVVQFVREERAHQRAHRLYNTQLAAQGYKAVALEARIERAVQGLEQALAWKERLALAAALEYLTALISRQALRGEGWLVHNACRQSSLWRWHCEEEVAHHGVALRLLNEVGQVGYGRRLGLYVLASLILLGDVARHTWDFFQTDRAQGRLTWGGGAVCGGVCAAAGHGPGPHGGGVAGLRAAAAPPGASAARGPKRREDPHRSAPAAGPRHSPPAGVGAPEVERRPGRQRAGHGATHRGPPAAVHGGVLPAHGRGAGLAVPQAHFSGTVAKRPHLGRLRGGWKPGRGTAQP